MVELTVGQVSGLIAAAVFLTQLFLPTAICLILIGVLAEQHSAVSWSVISRLIHGSYWPVILGADTASSTGVSRRVRFVTWLQRFALVLVGIAAIVTPLGLYDHLSPGDNTVSIPFHYAPDLSAFGKATAPRRGYKGLRICYSAEFGCPGAPPSFPEMEDGTEAYSVWQSSIDLFTSGKTAPTVSSLFDIEWRTYHVSHEVAYNINGTTPFARGLYRQLSKLILDNAVEAFEGLLVDGMVGRIGFRNHTIPVNVEFGAKWPEDILFIEPETRCVNTHLTIDYELIGGRFSTLDILNPVLVDQGGFTNLDHTEPEVDSRDFQADPDLYGRAYSAAWTHNMMVMQYFNVTTNGSDGATPFSYMDSNVGKQFDLGDDLSSLVLSPNTLQTTPDYGGILDLPSDYEISNPSSNSSTTQSGPNPGPNPLNITSGDFIKMGMEKCKYPAQTDNANMSAVGASCGMVYGAGERTDGGDPIFPDVNSKWRVPMYSCATATKAVIKQVTFQFNGTGGLSSLVIDGIHDKFYSNKAEMPLWGVESLDNFTIRDVRPLWGLVSPELGDRDDLSTIQREYLWLPGYPDVNFGEPVSSLGESNIPGNIFYMDTVGTIYHIQAGSDQTSGYAGEQDVALYEKWQDLSRNTTGTEQILNLIWADMAANSVVGTRGWLSTPRPNLSKRDLSSTSQRTADVPVHLWSRAIKYHIVYAIPAVVVLCIALLVAGVTLVLLILRRTGPERMSRYLAQTSSGRILGTFLYPGLGDPLDPTKTWVSQVGVQHVILVGGNHKTGHRGDFTSGPSYRSVPLIEEAGELRLKVPPL